MFIVDKKRYKLPTVHVHALWPLGHCTCTWYIDPIQTMVIFKAIQSGISGKSKLLVPDTGTSQYWWILEHFSVPVLPENVIFMFFRTCWCYSKAYNTGTQKWSSIVQYSCTSIWDLKYTFSVFHIEGKENQGCNLLEMFPFDVFTTYVKLEVGLNVWHWFSGGLNLGQNG